MPDSSWAQFYKKADGSVKQFLDELTVHRKFIETIFDCQPKTAVEVGCGTGRFSVFLSHLGVAVTAVDRDAGVLDTAGRIARALNGRVKRVRADAFELPFGDSTFDVCFHQGVLEHFDDAQIVALLTEQLRVARTVVFSVPNKHYPNKEFGDERLLSAKHWRRILEPFDIVTSRNYYRAARELLSRLKRRRPIMFLARIQRS